MPSGIRELEKLFKEKVSVISAATACFGAKFFNSKASAGAVKPYAVFQITPLRSNFGQARTSLQQVFFIDFKIYSVLPLPDSVDDAVAAVDDYFNNANTFTTANFRISIRHEKPLSLLQNGAKPDESIMMRGITFKAWVSKI